MISTRSHFECPYCQTPSALMHPLTRQHVPTQRQLRAQPLLQHIATELMLCECGVTHSWFDLTEVYDEIKAV